MKRFLISNPSLTNNQFARITSSGELTIVNTGVDGAWVTTEKRSDFCLAPRQSLPVGEQSTVEGLSLDGTFIIEVDGSVVPYSLTPDQLTQVFRPGNAYGIVIEKRVDGFFNIRNSVIKETEVRIFRSSRTGNFIDSTGVFKSLDTLGVEFGTKLSLSFHGISCAGATSVVGPLSINGVYGTDTTPLDEHGVVSTMTFTGLEVIEINTPFIGCADSSNMVGPLTVSGEVVVSNGTDSGSLTSTEQELVVKLRALGLEVFPLETDE